jgi:hypothetical protein
MAVAVKTGSWFWDPVQAPGAIYGDGNDLFVGNIDSAGVDQRAWLEQLQPGDVIHIDHVDDPNGWWSYTVTATPTPGGPILPEADLHLQVDKYSGSYIRVRPAPDNPTTVDFVLATTPGPGGVIYPALADIQGGAAVWADFNGQLGRLNMADHTSIYGSTLKEWIRKGSVFEVTKDAVTDPTHPNLLVGAEVPSLPPADVTHIKVTAGGHGPEVAPVEGNSMIATFMMMAGPPEEPGQPVSLAAQAVADYLGLTVVDDRMELSARAAQRWVERRRSKTLPARLWASEDVLLGAVMYAALLYQQKGQPQGFSGMDALGTYSEDTGMAMAQIFRLVGADPVIA